MPLRRIREAPQAGQFDRRIVVERETNAEASPQQVDAFNMPVAVWATYATLWALWSDMPGGEELKAEEEITRTEIVGSGLVFAGLILNIWAAPLTGLSRRVWART